MIKKKQDKNRCSRSERGGREREIRERERERGGESRKI
jgi:hypothetical protein